MDAITEIKVALRLADTPNGPNDTAIAGHAIATRAILVTNNLREFERVPGLVLEVLGGIKDCVHITWVRSVRPAPPASGSGNYGQYSAAAPRCSYYSPA